MKPSRPQNHFEVPDPNFWQCVVIAVILAALGFWLAETFGAPADGDSTLALMAPSKDFRQVGDYLLCYDGRAKCARWTLERLTPESVNGKTSRENVEFRADPELGREFAATVADYVHTGYDLGHLAAAANHARDKASLEATFLMSNAGPQTAALNRGQWRRLEQHLRGQAGIARCVWVVTAPLWLPDGSHQIMTGCADGDCKAQQRYSSVRFWALGEHQVWVPTHWAKAVLIEYPGGQRLAKAWILANSDLPQAVEDAAISVDEFERLSGLDVFAALPDDIEKQLEAAKPGN